MKKSISMLISLCIVIGMMAGNVGSAFAVSSIKPDYWIHAGDVGAMVGEDGYEGGLTGDVAAVPSDAMVFNIALRNSSDVINTGVIAVDYDESVLTLLNLSGNTWSDATNDSKNFAQLAFYAEDVSYTNQKVDVANGILGVSWMVNGGATIDNETYSWCEIMGIAFQLKPGKTTADFNENTIKVSTDEDFARSAYAQDETYWLGSNTPLSGRPGVFVHYGYNKENQTQEREAMTISYTYPNSTVKVASYTFGDTNNDGIITATDALFIYSYIANGADAIDCSELGFGSIDDFHVVADVDGNNAVTAIDALQIYSKIADPAYSFPVESEPIPGEDI